MTNVTYNFDNGVVKSFLATTDAGDTLMYDMATNELRSRVSTQMVLTPTEVGQLLQSIELAGVFGDIIGKIIP
jgi:hypothetical protein